MSDRLKCTVIIPTYNRAALLGHTLHALTRQTLALDEFEVIVVDDGSRDHTASVVDSYRDRLGLRYFFQEDRGMRVGAARNVGIGHARAPVCVFIDDGVLAHSNCLAAHMASHRATAEPVAVCGYIYGFTPDGRDAQLINDTLDPEDVDASIANLHRLGCLDIREDFYARYTDQIGDLPAPWLIYWTANVSARTDQVRAVGMFDEAFRTWGGEDLDLGYRLYRDGARFVFNRAAATVHSPHERDANADFASVAGNYEYMLRKYGTPEFELLTTVPPERFFEINAILRDRDPRGRPDHPAHRPA